ncbi:hypothetical protein [Anabaena sp. UHCC 0451]|uniref:hypothetical protein n=1 Tax=Anabaena sp. UHCC 0451 TaxID=2055235 RepID=UPI002B1EC67E|nr:hypothetical protein [Anabaena sp. UHCC 0451]MEA5578643.1 hypothetical protein [Anabaena sp. UHCC 0451]
MTILYTSDATMKALAKKVFGYAGRTFKVVGRTHYTLANFWNGGSKEFAVMFSRDGQRFDLKPETTDPYQVGSIQTFEIPVNHFIITHSIIQGQDKGITFYVHPEELPNDLPASDELTIQAKIVLFCYRCYKSSYAGIKDYRQHEATQIIKPSEYEIAKQELITKGLISARNSLTTGGKNIAAGLPDIYQLTQQYQAK